VWPLLSRSSETIVSVLGVSLEMRGDSKLVSFLVQTMKDHRRPEFDSHKLSVFILNCNNGRYYLKQKYRQPFYKVSNSSIEMSCWGKYIWNFELRRLMIGYILSCLCGPSDTLPTKCKIHRCFKIYPRKCQNQELVWLQSGFLRHTTADWICV
jgi:hypothetical protein